MESDSALRAYEYHFLAGAYLLATVSTSPFTKILRLSCQALTHLAVFFNLFGTSLCPHHRLLSSKSHFFLCRKLCTLRMCTATVSISISDHGTQSVCLGKEEKPLLLCCFESEKYGQNETLMFQDLCSPQEPLFV